MPTVAGIRAKNSYSRKQTAAKSVRGGLLENKMSAYSSRLFLAKALGKNQQHSEQRGEITTTAEHVKGEER